MGDLGVDLHDAAVPPGLHPGQYGAAEEHRAFDEEVQLGQVAGPGDLGHCGFGLRAGGVEDQHVNRAEGVSYRGGQPSHLALVRDIGAEASGGAAVVADGAADGGYLLMTEPLPATAVVRVSRGSFDPSRFAEVDAVNKKVSEYLVPAIRRLPGLIHWYAGVSPEGSIVNVSVWDSDEHAVQMDHLKEMTVDARGEMTAVGVTFTPIINHPVNWTI